VEIIIIILLVVIIVMLFHINTKLPSRDYVKEALERDKRTKKE